MERATLTGVYLVVIALLWYVVSLELEPGAQRRSSKVTPSLGSRRVADFLIIFYGLALGIVGELVRHQFGGVSLYSNLVSVPYFLWMIVLVGFYGRDLWLDLNAC